MSSALSGPSHLTTLELLARQSRRLISRHQHPSGAYPASPEFSAYRGYSWFRDGAFIADAMSAAGDSSSAGRFHDWCASILVDRREQIHGIVAGARAGRLVPDTDMLATRFRFDGTEGADDWWDFQLDGYGTWLWAVAEHVDRTGASPARWAEGIALATDYLATFWDRPCYDWWEEHAEQVHVSTLGCIIGGLEAARRLGVLEGELDRAVQRAAADARGIVEEQGVSDGRLVKWLGSAQVDASLAALIAPLGVVDARSPLAAATIDAVDRTLNVGGGVHRYLADTFYGGGQWPLLSCFLGLAFAAAGDRDAAHRQLRWAASTATEDGELPEQVPDHLLAPERRDEWRTRWGEAACPLLWSSAMYLRLAVELDVVTPEELSE